MNSTTQRSARGGTAPQDATETEGAALSRDGRDTRWEAHRVARREELLHRARQAIHDLGPEASMEEIAQQAGTSKSVFYRYFQDKNGLGQALGESVLSQLERRITDAARSAQEPAEVVRQMIDVYLMMVQRSPSLHAFVTTQAGLGWTRPEGTQRHTATLGLFADHVAALLLDSVGSLNPSPVHAGKDGGPQDARESLRLLDYWARSVIGMVHAAAQKWSEEHAGGTAPERGVVVDSLTAWIVAPVGETGPRTPPPP